MVASRKKIARDPFGAMRKGMLEFVLLRMIGTDRLYVADITARLAATPFKARAGTLYPLLGKMRREGLIDHEWREAAAGPPRKYYSLSKGGAQKLEAMNTYWLTLSAAVNDAA
jgi:PadR family transcriptional regulator PadR